MFKKLIILMLFFMCLVGIAGIAGATVADIGNPWTYEKNGLVISNSGAYQKLAMQWYDTSPVTINQAWVGVWAGGFQGYNCSIVTDSGGFPSTNVLCKTNSVSSRSQATWDDETHRWRFTFNQTVTLAANTKYWVVVDGTKSDGSSVDVGLVDSWYKEDGNIPTNVSKWKVAGYKNGAWVDAVSGSNYKTFGCIALCLNNGATVGDAQPVLEERTHQFGLNGLNKDGELIYNAPNTTYNITNVKGKILNTTFVGTAYFVILDKNRNEIARRLVHPAPVNWDWHKQTMIFTPDIQLGPGNSTIYALIMTEDGTGDQNNGDISQRGEEFLTSDRTYPYGVRICGTDSSPFWPDYQNPETEEGRSDAMMNMSITFGDPTDTNAYFVSPLIGSDSYAGTSTVYPFKTLAYASAHIPTNSSLWLMPGNYTNDVFTARTPNLNISAMSLNANFTGTSVINANWYSNIKIDSAINNLNVTNAPQTYYVSPSTGNNANTGKSQTAAWQTLSYALSHIQANSTLLLMPGTYANAAYSVPVSKVNISAMSTPISLSGNSQIYANGKNNITVSGININGSAETCFNFDTCDNLTIKNCIATNGTGENDAVAIMYSNDTLVQNCYFDNFIEHGVHVYNQERDPQIWHNNSVVGCTISNNDHNNIDYHGGINGGRIADNIMSGGGAVNIYLHNGNVYNITVENNTISGTGRPLELLNANDCLIQNNIMSNLGTTGRILISAWNRTKEDGQPYVHMTQYGCHNITFSNNTVSGTGRVYDFFIDGDYPVSCNFTNFTFVNNKYTSVSMNTLIKNTDQVTSGFNFTNEKFTNFTCDWKYGWITAGDFVFHNNTHTLYANGGVTSSVVNGFSTLTPSATTSNIWYGAQFQTQVSAAFTNNVSSGTAPLNVAFTDTSTGGPTTWSWNFGDSQTSTTQNPTHTFSSAGTYTVSLTASNSTSSSTATHTITVSSGTKTTPTITWTTPSNIVYGTALSGTQLNAQANTAGTFVYSPSSGTVLGVGTKTLNVTFTPTDSTNYTNATANVSINVTKANPRITWGNPADITYPTALSGTQLNATANVLGAFSYTPASGTVLNIGNNQVLSCSFVPTDATNYTNASAGVYINVLRSNSLLTWTTPANITYGTALSNTQLNAHASVNGTYVYNPPSGSILGVGYNILRVTFTPEDLVNYETTTESVYINVTKATPVLTWSNPANISYGTAINSTQLNAQASVPGSFVYSPASGTILGAGTRTLNVTFTPTDTTNYTTVTSNVSINISKQNTYITWNNPSNITFGTALSNTQLNAVGSVPGTKIYDPAAGTILKVGDNQSLNVTLVPTDSTNYSNSSKSVAINVTKGNVSLVWSKPRNMVYRTALSSTQLNAQAITEGTYTYTPSEGTYLSVGTHTLHVDFVPTDTTNYTNVSKNTTVLVLATNKSAVFTGNSLISGYPGARGWLEPNGSTSRNPVGTISYRFEYLSGIPSYDMGYTAQTTSQILTRFNSSVTAYHPGYCAIEGGVNDVDQGVDNTTILSNIRTEIQYCVDNNTQPLLYLIFPWSGASTAKSNQINYLNSQYKNFTTEFPDLIIVDVRPSVGYNYSGKWMALQSYDAGDNIHFNQAGYYKIGDVTWNALKTARINYPVAKFSFSPVSGRTPLKVRFTDSSTNTPTSWAWDLNNDGITDRTTTYSGQTFTYTYPAAGNYTAKLTVSNNAGSSSFRRTIHVSKRPNHYPW